MRNVKRAILAISALLLASGPAYAQHYFAYRITYFSDAAKTTIIGHEYLSCDGNMTIFGGQSQFYNTIYGNCP